MPVFICQGCGAEHTSWEGKCPQCGVSETIRLNPETDRMVGRLIKGKWKIVRKLGQGGMGAVYLAEQVGIGQRVALKFLKSEFSSDTEIAKRFLREAKSYVLVAHPNAVTFHDFGQDEKGNLFIAMEYCEGVDLKKVIAEQGRLPVGEAVEVAQQVADVLATAHSRGVIHRDLKPENIMIRRGLRGVHAKVLDFGIARLMDAGTRLTVEGAIAGTPRYMSPEQVEGREVDLRTDIYSLGIVLFEALTGHQPFDGMTIAEILRKQVAEPMPHLADRAPELDLPELDAVIQKACAKRRDDRWPDLLTFANALNQALPTQANLAVPLRLTPAAPPVAAPASQIGTGVAVPGTEIEKDSGAATLMKGATPAVARPVPAAATPAPGQPAASPTGQPKTSLDLTAGLGDEALVLQGQSRAPLIAAVIAVVALGGAGLYWFGLRDPEPGGGRTATGGGSGTGGGVAAVSPTAAGGGAGSVTGTEPNQQVIGDAIKRMNETQAANLLGLGKTEFEVAKLDAAESYLTKVDQDTESYLEARAMLGTIGKIREALKVAHQRRAAGQCAEALVLYRRVLALNPKVADALAGEKACRDSAVPAVMQ